MSCRAGPRPSRPADGPKGQWWTAFNDPLLNELEPQVEVSNQTVRQDYANYQEALAEVKVARSGLFPTIGVTGSATRARSATSSTSLAASRGFSTNIQPVSNSASLEGNVSWAPDLWGSVRRTIEENSATAQASEATLANATLSEQVTLATTVIQLRTSDANIALLQDTVKAYQHFLEVVSNQDKYGTIAPSDVVTARTQLETAQSSLIALGVARAQFAHAIAVLVGKNPEDLDIPYNPTLPTLPSIPVGRAFDPAAAPARYRHGRTADGRGECGDRRSGRRVLPDGVALGAGRLHAVAVGRLAAYRQLRLVAGRQRHRNDLRRRRAQRQVAAAKAAYDAAVANYRGTVLTAFEDVENDLSGLRILAEQGNSLDAAVRDATHGTEIAFNEYQAGTVDYTTVATAQATQLTNQQTALNVQESRLLDAASLFGDLGGGWSDSELHDPRNPDKAPAGRSAASAPAAQSSSAASGQGARASVQ